MGGAKFRKINKENEIKSGETEADVRLTED